MSSLFSTISNEAGFRLQYMEILNWGTFDGKMFRITPEGNNSLLTGANGSGKTTFIDALLTLIVPLQKNRFYNQSSGVEKKGDRTELSYVLGHYGDIQKEGEQSTTIQKLRDTSCYSILLANFKNTDGTSITLFQVRWFSGNEMKRSFGVAYLPLEIQKDFKQFDGNGVWKKLLDNKYNKNSTRRKLEFFDRPTKYAQRITKLFGMRSIKALSLFNQLVGIKVLGDLDGFIRDEMLDSKDAEEEYKNLHKSFSTLMDAKKNIEKAKEQIKQLEPINVLVEQLTEEKNTLKKLEYNKDKSVYWFADKGKELGELEKDRLTNKKNDYNKKVEFLKEAENKIREKITKVDVEIQRDEVLRQVDDLKKEKVQEDNNTLIRKEQLQYYNRTAFSVTLPKNPSENIFNQSLKIAKAEIKEIKIKRSADEGLFYSLKREIQEKTTSIQEAVSTIEILRKSGNNITGRISEIREELINAIGATRDEIPFVGELIAINPEEAEWEFAIEKALHNFGLKLLVPDAYYNQVNTYVNSTKLDGKITYERIKPSFSIQNFSTKELDKNSLVGKLDFKTSSPYLDWVKQNVMSRFNFLCTNDMPLFTKTEKAITTNGLIKFGKGRHEKDDRRHALSKERYVLGWDNKAKINRWRTKVINLRDEKTSLNTQFETIKASINDLDIKKDNLNDLIKQYPSFNLIDWESSAKQSEVLKRRIEKLKATNDRVKVLEDEKEILNKELKSNTDERDSLVRKTGSIEKEITDTDKFYKSKNSILTKFATYDIDISTFSEKNSLLEGITYNNFETTQKSFQESNNSEISKLKGSIVNVTKLINDKTRVFIHPSQKITNCFPSWEAEVSNLSLKIELISGFQEKYIALKNDDLPKYETRFNKYLEETLTNKVVEFNQFFNNWSEEILKNIDGLNKPLENIDFETSPQKTYIQLKAKEKHHELIKEFKNYLIKAIPNYKEIKSSVDGQKIHFENAIEPFILKLEDLAWREKVMDVRSWYEYKAEELYKEDNSKKKTYEGMGQLSGGEKAQLTYTVLGAAIAYQFGLTKTGTESNSFRFIAIDEAFKAQDRKKSNYLINLCKQLHLQLLVVTPSDNIDIVQDHISFVHFTSKRNEKNSWLYDMPIEQFLKERDKYIDK